MSNFNSNSNICRVLLIILTVVICISAVGGAVLGIINLNSKNTEKTNSGSLSTYPTEWYGDESYRYRLISDTEMEVESKKVVTGTLQPKIKYYTTENNTLKAVYVDSNTRIHYKMIYKYSVTCEYDSVIVNGVQQYTCKNVYFPSVDNMPEITIQYNTNRQYVSHPTEDDIREIIRYSAATNTMSDHVNVSTDNFQQFPNLKQEIHIILYDENYMACDEIILNN